MIKACARNISRPNAEIPKPSHVRTAHSIHVNSKMTNNVTTLITAYAKRWNGAADLEVANPNKRRRPMEHAAENDAG